MTAPANVCSTIRFAQARSVAPAESRTRHPQFCMAGIAMASTHAEICGAGSGRTRSPRRGGSVGASAEAAGHRLDQGAAGGVTAQLPEERAAQALALGVA